jgi:hypothetical protein
MDLYADTLRAFPPSGELKDPKQFHKRVEVHVQKIAKVMKESAFTGKARELLSVRHLSSKFDLRS